MNCRAAPLQPVEEKHAIPLLARDRYLTRFHPPNCQRKYHGLQVGSLVRDQGVARGRVRPQQGKRPLPAGLGPGIVPP